jgi:hypothetical protein
MAHSTSNICGRRTTIFLRYDRIASSSNGRLETVASLVGNEQDNEIVEAEITSLKPVRCFYIQPCMPGTQQWMINKIHDWLDDPNVADLAMAVIVSDVRFRDQFRI